jgi:hypothetical protein
MSPENIERYKGIAFTVTHPDKVKMDKKRKMPLLREYFIMNKLLLFVDRVKDNSSFPAFASANSHQGRQHPLSGG